MCERQGGKNGPRENERERERRRVSHNAFGSRRSEGDEGSEGGGRVPRKYARAHRGRRDKKRWGAPGRCRKSPKGRSSQRSLCGCLWLAPVRFGSLLAPRSNSCPFLRLRLVFFPSFCYSLVYVPLMGPTRAPNPPVLPVDDSLAPRSGRVSDCVITGSHTESSRIEWSRGESSRVAGSGATPQRSMRDISHHFPFNPSEL